MYWCKDDKANPCCLCDLSGWWFLRIGQPSFLSFSHCHLKNETSHNLHRSFISKGSILINIHEQLTLISLLIFKESFIRNPSNQEKLLYRLGNLHQGHQMWYLHEGLGVLMVSDSSVQHVAWEMLSPSRFESFISVLSHAKCVNNQGSKLDGINVPKSGFMLTKYYPSIAKMKGKVNATQIYHSMLMTKLHVINFGLIFWVIIMFLYSTINYVFTLDRSNTFLTRSWLNQMRQHKTSIFSSLCQCVKHNYN